MTLRSLITYETFYSSNNLFYKVLLVFIHNFKSFHTQSSEVQKDILWFQYLLFMFSIVLYNV